MGPTSLLVFVTFNLLCGIDVSMSSCCPKKTVGGIPYTLVTEGPTGQYGPLAQYGCSEDCVYQPAERPQDRVCFKPGVLETKCQPGCEKIVKRVNVNNIIALDKLAYNQVLTALKASNDPSSFKNISNYHGSPFMCDNTLQAVGTDLPCCINHAGGLKNLNQLFTPWHRLMTSQMEQAFNLEWQKLSPGSSPLAMPYWDWTEPLATPALPAFAEQGPWTDGPCKDNNGTTGCIDGTGITHRNFNGRGYDRLPNMVKHSYCQTTVTDFNNQIVNPHNLVHCIVGGVGGDMCGFNWASYDPIFYLHHSNVDKQYVFWQKLMEIQGKPITFSHGKGNWKMQPFDRPNNPFSNTRDNSTAPDGLDYKSKFCFEYDDLTFEGLSPQEFYDKYIQPSGSYCKKLLGLAAGVTVKNKRITASQTFDLVSGRTGERLQNIGFLTSLQQISPMSGTTDPNIYLYDVRDKVENTTFYILDKTHHYEVSKYESSNGSALPLDDTYKPVAIVQDPATDSRIFRLHTDHIKRYSPNLIHCQLDSKVEFLNSDGNYSSGVQLIDGQGDKTINGQFEVVKLRNKFAVTPEGGVETTVVNIGYDPNCHLQCGPDGLAVSEDTDFFVVAWQLGWLQARANSVIIEGYSVTVFVAWCAGAPATDIVQVTNKEDFEACTNLDGLPDLTYGSDGEHVDGFISVKNTADVTETLYYASKSNCKMGMKVKIEINQGGPGGSGGSGSEGSTGTQEIDWKYNLKLNDYCVTPGESVIFNWVSGHNVNPGLSKDDYTQCAGLTNFNKTTGPWKWVAPNTTGNFYFACGVFGHCSGGTMKANVTVSARC